MGLRFNSANILIKKTTNKGNNIIIYHKYTCHYTHLYFTFILFIMYKLYRHSQTRPSTIQKNEIKKFKEMEKNQARIYSSVLSETNIECGFGAICTMHYARFPFISHLRKPA